MSTIAAIIKEDPRPVREFVRETPAELDHVIHRCLQKDPARRVQHMDDLKVALQELYEESESESRGAVGLVPKVSLDIHRGRHKHHYPRAHGGRPVPNAANEAAGGTSSRTSDGHIDGYFCPSWRL